MRTHLHMGARVPYVKRSPCYAGVRPAARGPLSQPFDAFSIDSKDSCKPERCESPSKMRRRRGTARNGQGTSQEPKERRHMALSAQGHCELRTIAEMAAHSSAADE